MTANERRSAIFQELSRAGAPLSAASLARRFCVTRQSIVGDIALLRAEGRSITATARGYVIPSLGGVIHQIACCHSAAGTRDELNAMVDCGCTVLDVVVEHPVYGQLTAPLELRSRYDVEQFVARMQASDAMPLSMLTEGIHLHTVSCPSEDAFAHMKDVLGALGVLLDS